MRTDAVRGYQGIRASDQRVWPRKGGRTAAGARDAPAQTGRCHRETESGDGNGTTPAVGGRHPHAWAEDGGEWLFIHQPNYVCDPE